MKETSREPSPKIEVRIGVEDMVMMVNKTATPSVMKKINCHEHIAYIMACVGNFFESISKL